MLGVKVKPREMFKRFQLHILQPNTAQAQRLTIIRGPLYAQQPQQPLYQLHLPVPNIAQAQRLTIIRGPLYAQQLQLQQLTHQLSTAQAPKAIIIQ